MSAARGMGTAAQPARRGVVAVALPAVTVLAVIAAVLPACGPDLDRAPPELVGHWTTDAPRYADRAFVVSPDSIVFHTGGDTFTAHGIVGVDVEDTPEGTRYTIQYIDGLADPLTFSFYYDEGSASIRPLHQPGVVWTRESTS